jgi:hypothetical protein
MSCSAPKLLSYYSNKVNIYDNVSFIPLPTWRSCPPPSCVLIGPALVYPPAGPYAPPEVCPMPQTLNPPGTYCGNVISPYNPSYINTTVQCGTSTPCGPCGTQPQNTGCTSCR